MEELELKEYKRSKNMLDCPECHHMFEVEDYDSGDCPNCGKMRYYWDDDWNGEECGNPGFYWEKN